MSMRARSVAICFGLAVAACGGTSHDDTPHGVLLSIDVEPANMMVEFTGAALAIDYTAVGHFEDGTTQPLPDATFSLDVDGTRLGTFTDAKLAIGGTAAGKGGVFAAFEDKQGSTSVVVTVHRTTLGEGVDPNAADNFPDTSPVGPTSPTLLYPLDQAVMPTSVKAPNIQWENASAGGDLYRVRTVAGFATVDTILAEPPQKNFEPVAADWQLLVSSVDAGTVAVSVDHWDATNGAAGGTPVNVKLVRADITGAIYYWHLDAGRMERIDAMGRAPAIPNPPAKADGNQCVACHSVSRDGRYLAGSLWGGGEQGAVFDMSSDAVKSGTAPAPTVGPLVEGSTYRQLFTTFNPDATRLLVNDALGLLVVDPFTSASIATTGTPLPTTNSAHPSWSPDGTAIAFISNTANNDPANPPVWAVDYERGDLSIIPVPGPDSFGPASPIVMSATQQFPAASWPTWTPDSAYIAYGAGNHSRGFVGAEVPSALFMVPKAGGTPQRLDRACSGALRCYLPNFGPFDEGGYFWLIYYSFNDYGNATAGTKGARRRQMWITAIDKSKLGTGQDPSSVPYWVPDQDVTSQNMSAFWALPPPIQ